MMYVVLHVFVVLLLTGPKLRQLQDLHGPPDDWRRRSSTDPREGLREPVWRLCLYITALYMYGDDGFCVTLVLQVDMRYEYYGEFGNSSRSMRVLLQLIPLHNQAHVLCLESRAATRVTMDKAR